MPREAPDAVVGGFPILGDEPPYGSAGSIDPMQHHDRSGASSVAVSRVARRLTAAAEVALAFGAGTASFALVGLTLAVTDSRVLAVALGAFCVVAIVALARFWGVAYASPAAIAALLAYDWFSFPPTHARELPDSADLAELVAYLTVAVFVGELAAHAGRRADVTEAARSELAEEQAALRRVATLIARNAPPAEVFATVAREAGVLLGVDATHMGRYEPEDWVTGVGAWSRAGEHMPVGTRAPLEGESVCSLVVRTGRPARMDDYEQGSGPIAALLRDLGIRSSVGAPIVVDGRLWGVMVASSKADEPLPSDTESRIAAFTELAATAISNADAWASARSLGKEQAALRRVATLVARQPSPDEVFTTVADELGQLLGVTDTRLYRCEADGSGTIVADRGNGHERAVRAAARVSLEGNNVESLALRRGRPVRIDDYRKATGPLAAYTRRWGVRSMVGAPILVEGRVWGVLVAGWRSAEPPPTGTESRMMECAKLVATAISNVQARSELAASRARIVAAADEERRRVIRDLHDGAQQRLVHSIVTLKWARRALERHEDATALVTEALDQTQRANVELRELVHGILPAVLTRGGLRAGVQALASRMPVPVDNGVTVGRLPAAVEATAYFVVAEALTNVAKHAEATRAAVAARVEEGVLRIEVRDDGVGGARPDGSGLLGLADRVAVLDGTLRVESAAGAGTLLTAAIPLVVQHAESRLR